MNNYNFMLNIGSEIQSQLGDSFRIMLDNNSGDYTDIKTNETLKSQDKKLFDDTRTIGVISTDTGEIVGLKNIFATSFGFVIKFHVLTNKNIDQPLYDMIGRLNGDLQVVDDIKYLMTFQTPSAFGEVQMINSRLYQSIYLMGNISISDHSIFGNQLKIKVDEHDIETMIINADFSMNASMTPSETSFDSLLPISEYQMMSNSLSMTVHMRKDLPFSKLMFQYMINPNLLRDVNFVLSFDYDETPYQWTACKITDISTNFTTGGYAIMNLSFVRTELIE